MLADSVLDADRPNDRYCILIGSVREAADDIRGDRWPSNWALPIAVGTTITQ